MSKSFINTDAVIVYTACFEIPQTGGVENAFSRLTIFLKNPLLFLIAYKNGQLINKQSMSVNVFIIKATV